MVIASHRDIFLNTETGEEKEFILEFYKPEKQLPGEFVCKVVFKGAEEREKLIYGHDSLQALVLALRYARSFFEESYGQGWKLKEEIKVGLYDYYKNIVLNTYS